jgi:hypothetical protein
MMMMEWWHRGTLRGVYTLFNFIDSTLFELLSELISATRDVRDARVPSLLEKVHSLERPVSVVRLTSTRKCRIESCRYMQSGSPRREAELCATFGVQRAT